MNKNLSTYILIACLLVGYVSLYRQKSTSQSALFTHQAPSNTTSTKVLALGRYFIQNRNQTITHRKKSHSAVDFKVCASSIDSIKRFVIVNDWMITNSTQPNQSFTCQGGVPITYRVVERKIKDFAKHLYNTGFKKDFQALTCIDELKMRKILIDRYTDEKDSKSHKRVSKIIRMAFHDSMDYKNLMSAKNLDYKVDKNAPQGLDFCLHTGLSEAKPGEKKDILEDQPEGNPNHNRGLGFARFMVENIVNGNPQWTRADVLALGSIIAVQEFFKGPTIPFKMGRQVGECKMAYCKSVQCKDTQDYFFIHEPSVLSMDPKDNMEFFSEIGFTMQQAVALIGAHTVGGVNVCTGNKNPNNDAWCSTAAKFPKRNQKGATANLAQTYFDTTPATFDNQYFKEIVEYYTPSLPTCNQLVKDKELCKEPICNAENFKVRYTSLSSEGYENKELRKVAYLPADWAFQANKTTADIEKEFADNQDKFWSVFATAFEKVINRGYEENELNACASVDCTLKGEQFECGDLKFQTGGTDCKAVEAQNCMLIGGSGINGIINCGATEPLKCQMIV